MSVKSIDSTAASVAEIRALKLPGTDGAIDAQRARLSEERALAERRRVERQRLEEDLARLKRLSRESQIDPDKYRNYFDYQYHKATGRYFCRVMNAATNEVVREVPPRDELDRLAAMQELLRRLYSAGR